MEAKDNANSCSLSPELSDSDLLAGTRRLVGASNQLLAALLAHLAEVEARGVHRTRACSSLYSYCIYELRFSEDAAFRRVSAARLLRRFPALFDAIASGELHLTALLMLGPHLTSENFREVLARAKHRTKKEIARLVRELDPLPDVPPRIEPLGPAPAQGPTALRPLTWEMFTLSLNPIRNLAPGERPRDWMDDELASLVPTPAPARVESAREAGRLSGPQRYKVQFTATAEYVELVERAQALLSSTSDGAALAEVHLRAMRELVDLLEKRKYAVGARARRAATPSTGTAQAPDCAPGDARVPSAESVPRQPRDLAARDNVPRQRGRYIPAAVRREVFERDTARCTYVDGSGQRCRETRCLELHHLVAFARGGPHQASNLTLRCRAHNSLAAEEEFGRELLEERQLSGRHEPFSSHAAAETG
jgi:5-methylcytosine-specific restriction endonuclease McrA